MSRLDVVDDALIALAAFLDAHEHGPACVCGPCTAYAQATALLPRLGHVLAILEAWEREEAEEPILPQDIGMLLTMLDEGSTTRPAAARPPAHETGEGGG